ncbi:MAG: LytTR family DNA-binding domain-containing protein [Oscillospiraceae bacterium]|nr:LytTR family DNA-binding domain-containing protein [Oscillospiraceae bacterium]
MKIAICEDAEFFSKQLAGYANEWAVERNVSVDVFAYETAEEFLEDWNENEDYDIVFLDIIMGTIDGMELANIIRRTNYDVALVFVTNRGEYVGGGYDVLAMHFLTKPAQKEKIFACLDRANQSDRANKYFLVDQQEKVFRIPHADILYVEKFAHNAELVTAKGKHTVRRTMAQLKGELDDGLFVQCHKSYIVNIRRIDSYESSFVTMVNGAKIPLSKNMAKEINKKFIEYGTNKRG